MLAKAVFVALIAVSALNLCHGIASPAGPDGSSFSSPVRSMDRIDGKMDQMMNEAMQRIDSIKQRQKKLLQNNSTLQNLSLQNSTSTQSNSTQENSAEKNADNHAEQNISADIGSGSASRFNGLYAIYASRHEMGKSGVESKMVLNGTFEMDKSVKFQDQGF